MRKLNFTLSVLLTVLLLSGCGAVKTKQDWARLREATSDFTEQEILWEQTAEDEAEIKEKIDDLLSDGRLTQMEAVQIALLNNRSLQSVFEEIGISRADLVQAGLLENPTLGALFRFPFDEDGVNIETEIGFVLSDLWQIPFRKKVASAQMDATIMRVSEAVLNTGSGKIQRDKQGDGEASGFRLYERSGGISVTVHDSASRDAADQDHRRTQHGKGSSEPGTGSWIGAFRLRSRRRGYGRASRSSGSG
jgi:hypothetical protein